MNVLKYYDQMDDDTQVRARRILRKELSDIGDVMEDDDYADAVIEQVWNALVGFPTVDESQ